MVDVDSQWSQRQKWFQCFDGITSILFIVSSSECDQVLMEDWPTKCLVEFENIFKTIINNKTDLLEPQHARCSTTSPRPSMESVCFMFHAVTNMILKENLKDIMLQ
ncbi:hypothetical protein QTO34_005661 [Cnephaeus nilssonii]|uniref:Uncharacterized protein n=1 Tax=Cnephaeus nilssonii TaxID=3371016 RepID=A0AA40HNT4_CNENI|nr:hypothetical protein QTO34_005661 [Eptesicus nilssonii]